MTTDWKDRWALVTGASAGIGKALAEELARGGANLVLTARRRDRLAALAQEFSNKYQVKTEIVVADLVQPSAPELIFRFTQDKKIEIGLLVNNAGFGQYGEFHTVEAERLLEMVQLNCSAVLHLTRLYLPAMVARRGGDVLIVASTASFQAVPYVSTYAATKAFDLYLAEGLAEEMKPYGVRVCALCPGTTESEFHELAGHPSHAKGREQTAQAVARNGWEELRDLWTRELSRSARGAARSSAVGDPDCGKAVSTCQEIGLRSASFAIYSLNRLCREPFFCAGGIPIEEQRGV